MKELKTDSDGQFFLWIKLRFTCEKSKNLKNAMAMLNDRSVREIDRSKIIINSSELIS